MNDSKQPQRENVVPIKQAERRPKGVSLARLPAAMHALRDKSRQELQGLLRELFDKADDSLFELADQATSNQEQNLYFDSMREVRLRRRGMESEFFQKLDEGFAALLDTSRSGAESHPEDEITLDQLSLVQNDELEELVATENMVNKANDQFAEPIQHLTLRMDQLVPVKVYQKNNPLGADAICGGFTQAAKTAKIDVKAKLVLFKLFDKLVIARLGNLYTTLNQQLVEANILPSLKSGSVPGRRSNPAVHHQSGQAQGAQKGAAHSERSTREEEANQVLHTLRDLLGAQGAGSSEQSSGGHSPTGERANGEELGSRDLMQLLSRAQQSERPSQGTGSVNVQQLMQELLADSRRQNLNQVDEDVINLVGMMFEFILDDRNLAAPMKALLGRLQIPLVKVAIVDKSFFSKGGHPARRLLNEMAMAALGWQDTGEDNRQKDAFYLKLEQIVQTILSDFESDVSIFENMLLEFRSFQEKERRRAKILEQRTLDAEDGKARSEKARAEVSAALAELTGKRALEPAAEHLLRDAWSKVLFIICLKQGTDSDDWRDAVVTAEQLVWSTTATMDRDNRQKLLKMVPELLPKLRSGLESIAFNPYEMTQLFKQLEKLHLARLRGQAVPQARPQPAPQAARKPATSESQTSSSRAAVAPEVSQPAEETASPSASRSSLDSEPAQSGEPDREEASNLEGTGDLNPRSPSDASSRVQAAVPEPAAIKPEHKPAQATAVAVEARTSTTEEPTPGAVPTAQPETSSSSADPEEPLSESDPHLALVGSLTQGSWFEMQDGHGQVYRCRLAAVIKPTGKYIFVNRSGMKVAEETREGLARALKSGRLRILDDGMLFDRALEAVIGNLRSARAR